MKFLLFLPGVWFKYTVAVVLFLQLFVTIMHYGFLLSTSYAKQQSLFTKCVNEVKHSRNKECSHCWIVLSNINCNAQVIHIFFIHNLCCTYDLAIICLYKSPSIPYRPINEDVIWNKPLRLIPAIYLCRNFIHYSCLCLKQFLPLVLSAFIIVKIQYKTRERLYFSLSYKWWVRQPM